jgi:capsid portal protein
MEKMRDREPDAQAATEILWWGDYHPDGAYPQVRWHGVIPQIIGGREANEENARYLANAAIPQGLLLVGDGRVGKSSHDQLATFFEINQGEARGKLAVIEASTPRETAVLAGSGRVQIQWVSLRQAQHDDLTFSGYIKLSSEQVRSTFRLPSLALGQAEDLTRATALAAMETAEDQVYAPDRDDDDDTINNTLVADWGIRFWRVRSHGLQKRDPEAVAKQAKTFVDGGVVRPYELRPMAARNLGITLSGDHAPWQEITQNMNLAGITPDRPRGAGAPAAMPAPTQTPPAQPSTDEGGTAPPPVQPQPPSTDVADIAKNIVQLERQLSLAKRRDLNREIDAAFEGLDDD